MSSLSSKAKRNIILLGIATIFTVIVLAGTMLFSMGANNAQAEDMNEARVNELVESYIDKNIGSIHTKLIKYMEDQQKNAQQQATEQAFTNPLPSHVREYNPSHGNSDAPITIVDYSEFQCPFCARSRTTVKEISKLYEGKVRFVFKHFPLEFHPDAIPAAAASYAANKQGKFWEYHDALFANQKNLSEKLYLKIAADLNLDMKKFDKDRKSDQAEKDIRQDMADGASIGVRGTPFFLVNGVPLSGAQPVEAFKAMIDKHLAKQN